MLSGFSEILTFLITNIPFLECCVVPLYPTQSLIIHAVNLEECWGIPVHVCVCMHMQVREYVHVHVYACICVCDCVNNYF